MIVRVTIPTSIALAALHALWITGEKKSERVKKQVVFGELLEQTVKENWSDWFPQISYTDFLARVGRGERVDLSKFTSLAPAQECR